jgi:hypothetical protein
MGDPARGAHLGRVLRRGLAAASLGAGAIHVSAAFDHTEHTAQLGFFLVVAALQVQWAVLVLRRASWPLLTTGAALNAFVVLVWIVSRTVGLPGVPGAEDVQPLGLKDGASSALEFLLVAGIGSLIPEAGRRLTLASGRMASWVTVASIGALTAAGLAAPGHDHGEGRGGAEIAASGHHDPDGSDGRTRDAGDLAVGTDHDVPGHTHQAADRTASKYHDDDGHTHALGELITATTHNLPGHTHEGVDHGAPGHVHSPAHLHAPGQTHSGSPGPDHEQEAEHDHGTEAAPSQGHGHGADHSEDGSRHGGEGDDHREGGDHGDNHDHCPAGPENPILTQLRKAAEALELGCIP